MGTIDYGWLGIGRWIVDGRDEDGWAIAVTRSLTGAAAGHGREIGRPRTAACPWPAVRRRISTWEKPDAAGSAPDRRLGPPLSAIGDEEGRHCSHCPSFSRHRLPQLPSSERRLL
ncbi:hypothetical protein ACLOJK_028902 [Asimina triloba]